MTETVMSHVSVSLPNTFAFLKLSPCYFCKSPISCQLSRNPDGYCGDDLSPGSLPAPAGVVTVLCERACECARAEPPEGSRLFCCCCFPGVCGPCQEGLPGITMVVKPLRPRWAIWGPQGRRAAQCWTEGTEIAFLHSPCSLRPPWAQRVSLGSCCPGVPLCAGVLLSNPPFPSLVVLSLG